MTQQCKKQASEQVRGGSWQQGGGEAERLGEEYKERGSPGGGTRGRLPPASSPSYLPSILSFPTCLWLGGEGLQTASSMFLESVLASGACIRASGSSLGPLPQLEKRMRAQKVSAHLILHGMRSPGPRGFQYHPYVDDSQLHMAPATPPPTSTKRPAST